MFKALDKIVLKKDNKIIEINDSEFDIKNYMGYEIIGYKYILSYNDNEITFKSDDERLNFMNGILEESKNNLFEFYSKTFPIFYKYRTGKWRGEWKFVFKSDYLGVCYLL